MSEYQYFEFRLDGKSLSENEKRLMSSLSSRAVISSDMASYTYTYGDFRGNPKEILEEHFDAFLYLANWGSKHLIFKLPKALVNIKELKKYQVPELINIYSIKKYIIIDIDFCEDENESGNYLIDQEDWLLSLLPLRRDIILGDFRLLYLAWLKAYFYYKDSKMSKKLKVFPVPPGLNDLSSSHLNFLELFEIDKEILKVQSKKSLNLPKGMSKLSLI